MDLATTAASIAVSKRPGWRNATLLLALAWLVPFLVHLVPWSGPRPLGVYLLPLFWVTFAAAYLYGGVMGIAVGLFTPALNAVLTGLPVGSYFFQSCFELSVFSLVAAGSVRLAPRFFLLAPLSYLGARLAWTGWVAVTDSAVHAADLAVVLAPLGRAFTNGLSGLLVLAALNVALVRFFPRDATDSR